MDKYIDAEKLKAEIERRRKQRIEANNKIAKGEIFNGKDDEFNCCLARYGNRLVYQELFEIICFIETLQQEQPKMGLEVSEFCQPVPENIADCVAEHFWEMLDDEEKENTKTIETTHHEQLEVDLEKFISDFFDKKDAENNGRWSEDDIVEAITKAYELGLNARKEE